MSFVSPKLLNNLSNVDREAVDREEYGVVKVDDEGTVILYNRYESELAGVAPSDAEGRNFFTQVAPCSNNRLFFGKFKEGVANGRLDEQFVYTFTYKMRPTNVNVHLFRNPTDNTNWVFVKRAA